MASATGDLSSTFTGLRVNTDSKPKAGSNSKSKRETVADSWEDEAAEGSRDREDASTDTSEAASPIGLSRQSTNFDPHPPPPTPASPSAQGFSYSDLESNERFAHLSKTTSTSSPTTTPPPSSHSSLPQRATLARSPSDSGGGGLPSRRPDKTTATASRLIAAGLGMRAPKRTEAEREYDKVTRDAAKQERERQREEARRQQEEAERAKAAVWDD